MIYRWLLGIWRETHLRVLSQRKCGVLQTIYWTFNGTFRGRIFLYSTADIQVQIYSKSLWNSKGWRIGNDACLAASTIQFLNSQCASSLPPPIPYWRVSFNHRFPFVFSHGQLFKRSFSIPHTNDKSSANLFYFQDPNIQSLPSSLRISAYIEKKYWF